MATGFSLLGSVALDWSLLFCFDFEATLLSRHKTKALNSTNKLKVTPLPNQTVEQTPDSVSRFTVSPAKHSICCDMQFPYHCSPWRSADMKTLLCAAILFWTCNGSVIANVPVTKIPFSITTQEAIRNIITISVFSIDQAQETAFYKKLNRPLISKKTSIKKRDEISRMSLQDSLDFISSQRKNCITLTDNQRLELIDILLNDCNYFHGLFCFMDCKICALDVKSSDFNSKFDFTLVFGQSIISIYLRGEHFNALLNDTGCQRLLNWMKEIGVVKAKLDSQSKPSVGSPK